MSQNGISEINYRQVLGSFILGVAISPGLACAEMITAQAKVVEPPGQQIMAAWVEPPSGPYQFVPQPAELMPQPVQPDVGQATLPPRPSAGYPENQGGWYPPVGQMPLPAPDSDYAYEYRYYYQPESGRYGHGRTMMPPGGAYGQGNYPRNAYPGGMAPNYYPYGPGEYMPRPVQPYYW